MVNKDKSRFRFPFPEVAFSSERPRHRTVDRITDILEFVARRGGHHKLSQKFLEPLVHR